MSTKFNNSLQLQQTPKVCKIPPDKLPKSLTEFRNYPLQAFALWSNPFSPVDGRISGNTMLRAIAPHDLHFGTVTGKTHDLELDLYHNPVTKILTITVSLMIGAACIDQRHRDFTIPEAVLPFSLHMITWDHDGTTDYVQVRIMS